jgi:hypothetical protein
MAKNDEPAAPVEPTTDDDLEEIRPEERSGILQWIIFIEITVLCALAAYIQITGIKQLPLP